MTAERVPAAGGVLLLIGLAAVAPVRADQPLMAVLPRDLHSVRVATLQAMTAIGCETTEAGSPLEVRCRRPRKMALLIGSGGERVEVRLRELGPQATELAVRTRKTFRGHAGQRRWEQPLLEEIRSLLDELPARAGRD